MSRNLITAMVAFAAAAAQPKPNILFIMSDDHTSQAVGAYGGRLAIAISNGIVGKIKKGTWPYTWDRAAERKRAEERKTLKTVSKTGKMK